MTSRQGHRSSGAALRDLALAAASPAALALALCHGVAAALYLQLTNYDLVLSPPSLWQRALASLATVGAVLLLVWAASLGWQIAAALSARSVGRRKPHAGGVISAERWAGGQIARHTALTIALAVALFLLTRTLNRGAVVIGVFTGLWFAAALACGALRLLWAAWIRMRGLQTPTSSALLDESLSVPTADSLIDVAPPTWTFLVVIEGIFHLGGGTWVPILEMSALLRNMADEAAAMLLAPEALRLGAIIALFLVASSTWAIVWRLRTRPGRQRRTARVHGVHRAWALLVVLAAAAYGLLDERSRRLVVHHSHPSLDQVARLLSPSLKMTLRTEEPGGAEAAAKLYPDALAADGLPHPAAARLPGAATASDRPNKPIRHALIVFIDSISRRHLEPWGYARPVAPEMSRLAAQSIRFDRFRSNASQTDLATISLFYSLLPLPHLDKGQTYVEGHGGTPVHLRAAAAGMKVGVFSADWEVHERGHGALYPARCDAFLDAREADTPEIQAEIVRWAGRREDEVVDRFLAWYPGVHGAGDRMFAYVKFLRPHAPYYTPPAGDGWQPPFQPAADGFEVFDFRPPAGRVPLLLNRYDNSIRYADRALGRMLAHMQRNGALDETAIILLTDHGEAWGEHAMFGHSTQHFEEMIEVPFLLRVPGVPPGVDRRQASTIDVAPTLLDAMGLPADPQHQGGSLLDPGYQPRVHFAYSNNVGPIASLAIDEWKLIWIPGTDERWLFNLADDPDERRNLVADAAHKERALALMHLLRRLARAQLRRIEQLPWPSATPVAKRDTTE